jgi:hypothetical protein
LGAGLFSLAGLIVGYAVLGPLILDVIHFRTSVSGLNQVRGGEWSALGHAGISSGPPSRTIQLD